MNESILITLIVVALFGTSLVVTRIRQPYQSYVRMTAAFAMILFLWVFGKNAPVFPKAFLISIMLVTMFRQIFLLKRSRVKR